MKHLFLTIFLILAVFGLAAQNISVKDFYKDATDLTARVHPVKDENARNCALLKIITTETGFSFQPDAMGICKEVEFHTDSAEIWVWLAPGSRRITIAHPQLGQLRNYEYPMPIEASTVYVMELTTGKITTIVEEQSKTNYLALAIIPAEAAVKIDGNIVVLKDGQFQNRYAVGTHSYEAYCDLYYPKSGRFEIKADETTQLSIELQPNYGFLKVTSEPESGATVFINSKNVGTTPYTSDKLESKTYTVQVAKEMWHNATQQVVVTDNQTANVSFTLQPDFAETVFTCGDSDAEIWINDVKKGTGSWTGRLAAGVYKVETRKTSHRTVTQTFTLNSGDNRTLTLDAPTPIYGTIDVTSKPFGADIYLDGKKVGTTPKIISNVLIGSHEIKLQKAGFAPMTRSAAVKEGETAEIAAELPAGRSITVKSEPAGASLYIDGQRAGTTPLTTTLSLGTHTIKAVNDGVTKEETITVRENGQSVWTLNVQNCGMPIKDYDGNPYATVRIGEQCWMKENLRTTHYADGTDIAQGTSSSTFTAYWYFPGYSSSSKSAYGLLYNWKAVMRNSSSSSSNPSGVQGICPNGWHVPSDAEWKQLEMAVGMSPGVVDITTNFRGNIAVKLCANTGWKPSSTRNTPGSEFALNRNSSGFSALPAGNYDGCYYDSGAHAYFWSATESGNTFAYSRCLSYLSDGVYCYSRKVDCGFSVRCLRDFGTDSLNAVNDGVEKAQYEPLTQDAHVTEREVGAIDSEQLTAVDGDPVSEPTKLKQRAPMKAFFTLNAACSTAPQWSGGLRIGTTHKWGWNFSLMTNFNMKAVQAELPEAGTLYAFAEKKNSRLSATVGPVWHPDPRCLLFLNVGYGYRSVCYKALHDGQFYRYDAGTYQGVEASFGFMLNIKGLLLSVEATTVNFQYGEFKFGMGGIFNLKNKKK